MCGIFGIITKPKANFKASQIQELTKQFFIYSQLRGMEASGIAIKDTLSKEIRIIRRSINGKRFVDSSEFQQILESSVNSAGIENGITLLGHTRIATNGLLGMDNQPIEKNNAVGIHNGIICNIDYLWKNHPELHRKQLIDTELFIGLIKERLDASNGKDAGLILENTMKEIEGTASFGIFFNNFKGVILGSNCGSLYYFNNEQIFAFASEDYILQNCLEAGEIVSKEEIQQIKQLTPVSFGIVNPDNAYFSLITSAESISIIKEEIPFVIKDLTTEKPQIPFLNLQPEDKIRSLLEYPIDAIKNIKRCTKCILPETHPFIHFDEKGVCNYCRDYDMRPKKIPLGKDLLLEEIAPLKKKNGINSMLMLSGGRDSCYALHIMKEELGLNPVAYSYDWGMLTDLGRRNQSRMCGKLGVEHIVISADIKKKRKNIRMNVEAWLNKPDLGMIGLFMAGDKVYHSFAGDLYKRMKLPLFNGGCPLEYTYFKHGFSKVKPSFEKKTFLDKFDIMKFYLNQALTNPKYINSSNWDSLLNYSVYYFYRWGDIPLTPLFKYLPWNEEVVNDTLINKYNWELSPDTTTSWRIGDGTAAFYNYIYHTVAGFTENDCFRSNQILEGVITRERALEMAMEENKPRYESLKWYFDTIGVDLERAIKVVNSMPKLYPL